MKNIVLSAVAVAAMSSFAVAGGDIAPIEEPVVVEEVVVVENLDAGFYLGLGYGSLKGEETFGWNPGQGEVTFEEDSRDFDQLLLQAGYKFNAYVAIEGRYWFGMNDLSGVWDYDGALLTTDASLDAWGIYVKPMYPVTDAFDIYALLGYATSSLEEDIIIPGGTVSQTTDLDGFSWGLGVAYTFNDSISIFADYVSLYDDTVDYDVYNSWSEFQIDTVNVGVSYKF
ncbi:MAG: porin family protein [Campylobacterota bacterium]|nr:porin family protein [Campylobacterota bacterium]